jgi:ABC-2 type transport system ATP-binding protein
LIQIQNLTKRYGKHIAVSDITFTVGKGEIVGFLGPNGAGKTTTMNVITGYTPPTHGAVKVCGFDVAEDILEVKKRIGYLPENPPLYPEMTVEEYLTFVCQLKRVAKAERRKQIDYVTDVVKLTDARGRLIKNLSKGFKQRVGFAQALLGAPEVLILDEPTVGLDPQQIIEIRELIKSLAQKHTILLSSHILPEVSAVCSRIVMIHKGRIVTTADTRQLMGERQDRVSMVLEVEGEQDKAMAEIALLKDIEECEATASAEGKHKFTIRFQKDKDIRRDLFYALAKADLPIFEMSIQKRTLEDIFLERIANEEASKPSNETPSPSDGLENAVLKEEDALENAVLKEEDALESAVLNEDDSKKTKREES